jgi:hypothetical protein
VTQAINNIEVLDKRRLGGPKSCGSHCRGCKDAGGRGRSFSYSRKRGTRRSTSASLPPDIRTVSSPTCLKACSFMPHYFPPPPMCCYREREGPGVSRLFDGDESSRLVGCFSVFLH